MINSIMKWRGIFLLIGLAFLAAAPLLVALEHQLASLNTPIIWHEFDNALLEMKIINASSGRELLGAYSRFQWNHPGPAYFYALVPIYLLAGKSATSLQLGVVIIHLVVILSLFGVLWSIYRKGEWCVPFCAIALVAVYLRHVPLASIWNPDVLALPFILLSFLCAAICVGYITVLPAMLLIGSFLIQTHLGVAPCILALIFASLVIYSIAGVRKAVGLDLKSRANPWIWVGLSVLTLLAMWIPPIIEQFNNNPGNLTKIIRFLGVAEEKHSFLEALQVLSAEISWLSMLLPEVWGKGLAKAHLGVIAVAIALLQIVLLAFTYRLNIRQRQYFSASLCLLGGVAFCVALVSVMHIRGPIHGFLVGWMSAIGLIISTGVACGILKCLSDIVRDSATKAINCSFILLGLGAIVYVSVVHAGNLIRLCQQPTLSSHPQGSLRVKSLSNSLLRCLEVEGIKRPLIQIIDHSRWPVACGVALQLLKANKDFSIDENWLFMFGSHFAPSGKEDASILFSDKPSINFPDCTLIARHSESEKVGYHEGDTFVYLCNPDYSGSRFLKVGARINLNTNEADRYLLNGWSGPESAFRWTDGKRARIVFRFEKKGPLMVKIKMAPFIVSGKHDMQTMKICLNKIEVANLQLRQPSQCEYQVILPESVLQNNNIIDLVLNNAESPFNLGLSQDRRRLGIAVQWIQVDQITASE